MSGVRGSSEKILISKLSVFSRRVWEPVAKLFDAQNRPFESFCGRADSPALLGRPPSAWHGLASLGLARGLKIIDFSLSWSFATCSCVRTRWSASLAIGGDDEIASCLICQMSLGERIQKTSNNAFDEASYSW